MIWHFQTQTLQEEAKHLPLRFPQTSCRQNSIPSPQEIDDIYVSEQELVQQNFLETFEPQNKDNTYNFQENRTNYAEKFIFV